MNYFQSVQKSLQPRLSTFVFHLVYLSLCFKKALSQTLNMLTVILSVCNAPSSITPFEAHRVLSSNMNSVAKMMNHCSKGKAKLNVLVVPFEVQIPCPSLITDCAMNTVDWAIKADDAIRRYSMIRVDDYSNRLYILPNGCSFSGLGNVGPCMGGPCRIWINGKESNESGVYLHEIGHNLGLLHANYNGDSYGDMSDIMGYCCSSRCFNAGNSQKLGFTKAKVIYKAPGTLENGTRLLTLNEYVQIDDSLSLKHWYIQNRQSDGIDIVPDGYGNSVNIYSMGFGTMAMPTILEYILNIVGDSFVAPLFSVKLKEMKEKIAEIELKEN